MTAKLKKVLKLSKDQVRVFYRLLSAYQVPNSSDNRKRWRFLEIIEDFANEFDDEVNEFDRKGKTPKEINVAIIKLGEQTKKFTFNDRELFAKVKDMFEKLYAIGTVTKDEMGRVIRSPLTGRSAKIYVELENAFADVQDIKVSGKKKK